jgi:three-Cys-motif partner protein
MQKGAFMADIINPHCPNCRSKDYRYRGDNLCTIKNASDGFKARCGQPWTTDKMRILKLYDHLFTNGMKNKFDRLCYIDLYSGPGIYFDNANGSQQLGSPLIALEEEFTDFFFNDINTENHKALNYRTKEFKEVSISNKDANIVANEINKNIPKYSLSFCFVDPNNMKELKYETLADISRNRKVDLLINFAYGSDYRRSVNYLLLEESDNKKFDEFFGTNKWRAIEEKFQGKDILFRADALLNLYISQLEKLGYIKIGKSKRHSYIFNFYNSKKGLLYYLIFVSKHRRGYDFCKKIRKYIYAQQELL